MKKILLSIQPKWVAKILNGEKTIEVRKCFPKDYKGWVYIYCTKKGFLYYLKSMLSWAFSKNYCKGGFNGKVVARFYCDNVEEISYNYRGDYTSVYTDTLDTEDLEKHACLTRYEFAAYLDTYYGYAIHISNLEIFDKPKELSEFKTYKTYDLGDLHNCHLTLTKAPQNYQWIEAEE